MAEQKTTRSRDDEMARRAHSGWKRYDDPCRRGATGPISGDAYEVMHHDIDK
jgi:hypothetical protein